MTGKPLVFFDECLIKLGRKFARRYPNVLISGEAPCSIGYSTKDILWIPHAGEKGWICITKDNEILYDPKEQRSIIEYNLKLIVLMNVSSESTAIHEDMVNSVWFKIPTWSVQLNHPWVVRVERTDDGHITHYTQESEELRRMWNIP